MHRFKRTWLLALSLAGLAPVPAAARDAIDPGLYAVIDEGSGELSGKVIRVTRTDSDWKFEDRQPDGSWLDVSCHGGCEHAVASAEHIQDFFGAPPPPDVDVSCVYNAEYAFCRAINQEQRAYSLVVRVPTAAGRLVVAMLRAPEEGDSAPPPAPGKFF